MATRETGPSTNRTFGVVHWDPKKKDEKGGQGQGRQSNTPAGQEALTPREKAILAALGVNPNRMPQTVQPGVDFENYGPQNEAPMDVRLQQTITNQTMNNTLVTSVEGLQTITGGETASGGMANSGYLAEPDQEFLARLKSDTE